jgi:hypothetical protein
MRLVMTEGATPSSRAAAEKLASLATWMKALMFCRVFRISYLKTRKLFANFDTFSRYGYLSIITHPLKGFCDNVVFRSRH